MSKGKFYAKLSIYASPTAAQKVGGLPLPTEDYREKMGKKPAPGYVFGSRVLRLSFGALSSKVDACSRKIIKLLLWSLLLFFYFFLFLPRTTPHNRVTLCTHSVQTAISPRRDPPAVWVVS